MANKFGMAQNTYEEVAEIAAHEDAHGRVNPAIIRSSNNLLIVDLARFNQIHNVKEKAFMFGFLVVSYSKAITSNVGLTFAYADGHYVQKSSSEQRYLKLGGNRSIS